MPFLLRRIAAFITLVTAIWTILAGASGLSILPPLPTGSIGNEGFLGALIVTFGAVLFVDGLLCLVGLKRAFFVGAADAVLLLVSFLIPPNPLGIATSLVAITLTLMTLLLDLAASRSAGKISEQAHPMNLPVFG